MNVIPDDASLIRDDQPYRAHEQTGTIRVTHRLLPVVVVMAGADVIDPFKD